MWDHRRAPESYSRAATLASAAPFGCLLIVNVRRKNLQRTRAKPRIDNPLGLRNNFLCATFLKVGGAIS